MYELKTLLSHWKCAKTGVQQSGTTTFLRGSYSRTPILQGRGGRGRGGKRTRGGEDPPNFETVVAPLAMKTDKVHNPHGRPSLLVQLEDRSTVEKCPQLRQLRSFCNQISQVARVIIALNSYRIQFAYLQRCISY